MYDEEVGGRRGLKAGQVTEALAARKARDGQGKVAARRGFAAQGRWPRLVHGPITQLGNIASLPPLRLTSTGVLSAAAFAAAAACLCC